MYLGNLFVIGHTPTEILDMKSGPCRSFWKKNFAFLSSLELLRYKIISDFLQGKSVTTLKTYSSLLKEGN